ncbi:MAG: hypothetical protein FWE23_10365 [Chitinivibrionia bacterium]|nr:hypothetical protein [Chitinivibrionia bacterium]
MLCQLELDVVDKKEAFAKDFFSSISFVKNVRILKEREITNPKVLSRINRYETGRTNLLPMSFSALKKDLVNA